MQAWQQIRFVSVAGLFVLPRIDTMWQALRGLYRKNRFTCSERDDKKLPTIGEIIKQYRIKAGMSQQQLGEKLGLASVAQQRVSQWENGYRTPASEHLLKLMAVLNIPPEAFDEYKNNI